MSDVPIQNGVPVLLREARGPILLLTLNRPHAKHAFDRDLATALSDALDRFEEDESLSVAVLTGSGGTFSSGADLKALLRGERGHTEKRGGFGIMKRPPDKPLVAAVEGYAVAGGFELTLCADVVVAASDARFGLPEVRRGLVAVGGALFRLPRRIPYHVAMEMALTGDLYSAARMRELGLVNRVTDPGKALEGALDLAVSIASGGPLAVRATKQIVRESQAWTDDAAWTEQRRFADVALRSEDAREGPRAFAEKRRPVWKGR
ncbi:MAG TPA: crotonase/enoyl-CoA hydratase family protein [Polyangiaceae bacterium]|nr:crotonase/enoyl-CoA hydratase family protein [Polyangiaceae bacterium]